MSPVLEFWRERVFDTNQEAVELPTEIARWLFRLLDAAEAHAREADRERGLSPTGAWPRYNRVGW